MAHRRRDNAGARPLDGPAVQIMDGRWFRGTPPLGLSGRRSAADLEESADVVAVLQVPDQTVYVDLRLAVGIGGPAGGARGSGSGRQFPVRRSRSPTGRFERQDFASEHRCCPSLSTEPAP